MDRDAGVAEGELGRLDRATQIRGVHGIDAFSASPLAESAGEAPAFLRQLAREPAGRDPGLVVRADRMSLEDDLGRHRPATWSTAVPRSCPLRKRSSASFASSRANVSTSARTGTSGASARNSAPSRRVRFATERKVRSPQRSSYGKEGMSVMWMPAQTTLPPFATARSATGTSSPTGAKMIAASNSSGAAPSDPPRPNRTEVARGGLP